LPNPYPLPLISLIPHFFMSELHGGLFNTIFLAKIIIHTEKKYK
jgi:hypothetical protein